MRLPFETIYNELFRILLKLEFSEERARLCARLFTETSRDGVYSHGINRFPRFVQYINEGFINIRAQPKQVSQFGAMEQWDGHLGPGNLNAWQMMERGIEQAKKQGIALIGLRNTNHWMRGGTYGWLAAENNCIAICATNTIPNMPAWGAQNATLGNNPLIIAIPKQDGHIVFDASMTQFSFGKIETYARAGKALPVPGGYDTKGNISTDPQAIEVSGRALPIGYWKGSGLSLMLDLLVATFSGGLSAQQIGLQHKTEYGLSQFFLTIDPTKLDAQNHLSNIAQQTIDALHQAIPSAPNGQIFYPGERTLQTRKENNQLGIPVDEKYWALITRL